MENSVFLSTDTGKIYQWTPGSAPKEVHSGAIIYTDIALAPDGTLYGITETTLYRIDLEGSGATAIGPMIGPLYFGVDAMTGAAGFAIDENGRALVTSDDNSVVAELDLATGAVSNAGTIGRKFGSGDLTHVAGFPVITTSNYSIVYAGVQTSTGLFTEYDSTFTTSTSVNGLTSSLFAPGDLIGFSGKNAYDITQTGSLLGDGVAQLSIEGKITGASETFEAAPVPTDPKDIATREVEVTLDQSEIIDTWTRSSALNDNSYGRDNEILYVGGWGDTYHSYIKFDLDAVPSEAVSVTLRLSYDPSVNIGSDWSAPAMELWRVDGPWFEGIRWIDPSVPSATYVRDLPAVSEFNGTTSAIYDIDITSLYRGWIDGGLENHGLTLRPQTTWANRTLFASSEVGDATLRPRLIVEIEENNNLPEATADELFAAQGSKLAALAQMALAAYEGPGTEKAAFTGWHLLEADELEGVEALAEGGILDGVYDNKNSQATVARSADALVIAFRGTEFKSEFADVLQWVRPSELLEGIKDVSSITSVVTKVTETVLKDMMPGGLRERFENELIEVLQDGLSGKVIDAKLIEDVLTAHFGIAFGRDGHFTQFDPLRSALEKYIVSEGISKVYVTGHSLGASMTSFFMLETPDGDGVTYEAVAFANPGSVYKFGPEVTEVDPRVLNITADGDPVNLADWFTSTEGDDNRLVDGNVPAGRRSHDMRLYAEVAKLLGQEGIDIVDLRGHGPSGIDPVAIVADGKRCADHTDLT